MSVSLGVSLNLDYISEETTLATSTNCAWRYYDSALLKKGVEINMSMLRAMATWELTEEENQAVRIMQFAEKGWLKSRKTKATLTLLKAKLMCRYNLLKDTR